MRKTEWECKAQTKKQTLYNSIFQRVCELDQVDFHWKTLFSHFFQLFSLKCCVILKVKSLYSSFCPYSLRCTEVENGFYLSTTEKVTLKKFTQKSSLGVARWCQTPKVKNKISFKVNHFHSIKFLIYHHHQSAPIQLIYTNTS